MSRDFPSHEGDEGYVRAVERWRRERRAQVSLVSAELFGDEFGKRIGLAVQDLVFAPARSAGLDAMVRFRRLRERH